MMGETKMQEGAMGFLRCSVFCLLVSLFAFYILDGSSFAQPISSEELIRNNQNYDAKEITYEGEVIGEVMRRKDGVWVNVYDNNNCIGVWMTKELAGIITYAGSYKTQGDIVQVDGVFNKSCPEHGGDLDIHATSLRKIKSGWVKEEKLIPTKRNLLIILSVILCLILILRIFITR